MAEVMRNGFDRELSELHRELIDMGSLIEQSIDRAVKAFEDRDVLLAREAVESDRQINDQERRIESHCLKLLLQQQPVATDLRMISTALKMITDMERIGDHAADISEITLRLAADSVVAHTENILRMAKETIDMVKKSVDAFVQHDLSLAQEVIRQDDVVDELFDKTKEELVKLIQEDAEKGRQFIDLVLVAKYFERMGDDAERIAGWAVFRATGEHALHSADTEKD